MREEWPLLLTSPFVFFSGPARLGEALDLKIEQALVGPRVPLSKQASRRRRQKAPTSRCSPKRRAGDQSRMSVLVAAVLPLHYPRTLSIINGGSTCSSRILKARSVMMGTLRRRLHCFLLRSDNDGYSSCRPRRQARPTRLPVAHALSRTAEVPPKNNGQCLPPIYSFVYPHNRPESQTPTPQGMDPLAAAAWHNKIYSPMHRLPDRVLTQTKAEAMRISHGIHTSPRLGHPASPDGARRTDRGVRVQCENPRELEPGHSGYQCLVVRYSRSFDADVSSDGAGSGRAATNYGRVPGFSGIIYCQECSRRCSRDCE